MAKNVYPIFRAEIKSGKMTIFKRDVLNSYIANLADGFVELTIRPEQKLRSAKENNYYWGVLIDIISNETGLDPDEVHEHLGSKFRRASKPVKGVNGQEIMLETRVSSKKMTPQEFEDYCSQCRVYASSELGIFVPLPNEVDFKLKD